MIDKLATNVDKSPEKSKEQSSDGADGSTTDTSKVTKEAETTADGASPSAKRVEVQFLDTVVASGNESGPSVEDEYSGCKTLEKEKAGKGFSARFKRNVSEVIGTSTHTIQCNKSKVKQNRLLWFNTR